MYCNIYDTFEKLSKLGKRKIRTSLRTNVKRQIFKKCTNQFQAVIHPEKGNVLFGPFSTVLTCWNYSTRGTDKQCDNVTITDQCNCQWQWRLHRCGRYITSQNYTVHSSRFLALSEIVPFATLHPHDRYPLQNSNVSNRIHTRGWGSLVFFFGISSQSQAILVVQCDLSRERSGFGLFVLVAQDIKYESTVLRDKISDRMQVVRKLDKE